LEVTGERSGGVHSAGEPAGQSENVLGESGWVEDLELGRVATGRVARDKSWPGDLG
jgi:hypothetical protein